MTFRSAAYRVYSRWARTSDHSRRSIYAAINEAYAAGQAAALENAQGHLVSLVTCAQRLDPSERHLALRAEGCGWCGGDHLAELSALATGS